MINVKKNIGIIFLFLFVIISGTMLISHGYYVKNGEKNIVISGKAILAAPTIENMILQSYSNGVQTDNNNKDWAVVSDTTDEYRYVGQNPNNFICFKENCNSDELYRIIGIINNNYGFDVASDTGQVVKVIKNTPIGSYAWNEKGTNLWQQSPSRNKTLTYAAPTSISLTARYHLYGTNSYSSVSTGSPSVFYNKERI